MSRPPWLTTAREALGYRRLLAGRAPRVGYVGWTGKGNAGDEALYRGLAAALPNVTLVPVPNLGRNRALRTMQRIRPLHAVLLGGGTLIGNGYFRRTLEALLDVVDPEAPLDMLGVGVESHDYAIGRRAGIERELEQWVPLLARFASVRVRGPLSQASLAKYGVDSVVVGDPALLLDAPAPRPHERLLGVNVGETDDLWGGDPAAVYDAVARVMQVHADRGWQIRLLPTWSKDVAIGRALADRVRGVVEVREPSRDLAATLASFAECTTFVGEKLHSVVFAALAGVPAVALEYRPKCRDFQASIGREPFTVRTDQLDADTVITLLDDLGAERDDHAAAVAAGVAKCRQSLHEHAPAVAAHLRSTGEGP